MSADNKLLELAAKAEGRSIEYMRVIDGNGKQIGEKFIAGWNPLLDNGDALMLAVKLNILTYQTGLDGAYAATPMNWSCVERDGDDQCAKTRRAIVRAAAEIGKAMV